MIDEECGYILNLGIEFVGGKRIDSLKALLAQELRRDLRRLRRAARPRSRDSRPQGSGEEHPHRHRLAVVGVVRPYRQDRQTRHRAGRRQHRDGLLPLLAPARRRGRQGDRALRLRGDEGVPLGERRRHARGHSDPQFPGAEGVHPRQRQADRRACSRRSRPNTTTRAAATWCRPASRISTSRRRRAGGGRPGERLPLDRARRRHRVRQVGHAQGRPQDHGLDQPEGVLRRRRAFGPKNIIWAVAHGHDAALSIHKMLSGEDITDVRCPRWRSPARRWASTSGATTTTSRTTSASGCRIATR